MAELDRKGGVVSRVRKLGKQAAAGLTFARLYMLPTVKNELPDSIRLQPAW
jgi:magnesium-protoporphyrin IX monomethyl ester (oxidative) cyclase